jgi:hypothetical protein
MYTKGIKKIFSPSIGMSLAEAENAARTAGFEAFSYNGQIIVKAGNDWLATCFHITDFSDGQV